MGYPLTIVSWQLEVAHENVCLCVPEVSISLSSCSSNPSFSSPENHKAQWSVRMVKISQRRQSGFTHFSSQQVNSKPTGLLLWFWKTVCFSSKELLRFPSDEKQKVIEKQTLSPVALYSTRPPCPGRISTSVVSLSAPNCNDISNVSPSL